MREVAAHNNAIDATEDGAYSLALAAVEEIEGLFAIGRAETRTGADYYVGHRGEGLEHALRLEVSGLDAGNESAVRTRLKQKVDQARAGISNLPAMAAVVGFQAALISMRSVQ